MNRVNGSAFYQVTIWLKRAETIIEYVKDQSDGNLQLYRSQLSEDSKRNIIFSLTRTKEELRILGARFTLLKVNAFLSSLENDELTNEQAHNYCRSINDRLADELGLIGLFVVDQKRMGYLNPHEPLFGRDFAEKFNTQGAFELEEAATCLALGRFTASVFHLMRLMEIGIGAVARCLQIPDPVKPSERNWGKILDRVRYGIDKHWPTTADRMSGDGELFDGLYASLDAVKNPWRNSTMHVENKYTEDEAEHIFVAVKGFMKKISSRMDEDGLPLA
jgi:hypothetical protein